MPLKKFPVWLRILLREIENAPRPESFPKEAMAREVGKSLIGFMYHEDAPTGFVFRVGPMQELLLVGDWRDFVVEVEVEY